MTGAILSAPPNPINTKLLAISKSARSAAQPTVTVYHLSPSNSPSILRSHLTSTRQSSTDTQSHRAPNDIVIQVRDLRKSYDGLVAVDGISFEVHSGEIFGMLGPNGAGKTTTVEILEGLRDLDGGEAYINGLDVTKNSKRVKGMIGVQLQQNAFFDNLNLSETVQLFATLYDSDIDAEDVLAKVDLADRAKSQYRHLSGGQKQRLSIAVALVNDPVAMFLDEPTTGLDPQARRNMWDLIDGLRSNGMAIMMTTHYMEEAEVLCDRVAVIDHGNIVANDTPQALIDELKSRGAESVRKDGVLTLEDVFIDLTGRSLVE